jgi:hypothetical protein
MSILIENPETRTRKPTGLPDRLAAIPGVLGVEVRPGELPEQQTLRVFVSSRYSDAAEAVYEIERELFTQGSDPSTVPDIWVVERTTAPIAG